MFAQLLPERPPYDLCTIITRFLNIRCSQDFKAHWCDCHLGTSHADNMAGRYRSPNAVVMSLYRSACSGQHCALQMDFC